MKKTILYRGSTKLTTSDPAKYQVTNSSGVYNLTVLNAQESDAGSYACSTEALEDEHGVNLVVISKYYFNLIFLIRFSNVYSCQP